MSKSVQNDLTMCASSPLGYSRVEAAHAIGISLRTLDTLKADTSSGIPFVKIGARIIFPAKAFEEWLDAQIGKGGNR